MAKRACGLCGQSARYLGSHVLNDHLPYARTHEMVLAALEAELAARKAKGSR